MTEESKRARAMEKRARQTSGGWGRRLLLWLFGLVLMAGVIGALAAIGFFFYLVEDLPKISSLADYRPATVTTVYADDEQKIAEFYKERRLVMPLEDIPPMLVEAFIAAEDSRFYEHSGIDFKSILRAFFKNLEAGTIVQGGSTITQQVTKSFFLTPERSYKRKLKEAVLAYRISETFSKEEVLFLYLNQIYLGHGAYGVQAAAQNYFDKPVQELTLAECAILAGLPQAPSRYSPHRYPERARQRQLYVLSRMEDGRLHHGPAGGGRPQRNLGHQAAAQLVCRGGTVLYGTRSTLCGTEIRRGGALPGRAQHLYGGQRGDADGGPGGDPKGAAGIG